jgi:ethanolamine utilization protein EutA
MGEKEMSWITSAGIDIGTSTTKMIVSRLKLVRTSGTLSLPRYEIGERQLLYASPIYSTPLKNEEEVDVESIWAILSKEFVRAGIVKGDLKSGAVIITGEAATTKNASQIVHLLAERSGDFVVATAGADLEALLAGKGAGADRRSKEVKGAIANMDIGGGTANVAIFQRGKTIGTVTFHIGGRLIQIDERGILLRLSPSLLPWLKSSGYKLELGDSVTFHLLKEICLTLCHKMLGYLSGYVSSDTDGGVRALLLGKPLAQAPVLEEWMVSGGIGRLMKEPPPTNLVETAIHQDIGPLLAHTLKACMQDYSIRSIQADETVRATVIGAGMQSTEISGATVHLDPKLLPIRNLPVLKLEVTDHMMDNILLLADRLAETMRTGVSLFDQEVSPSFALALTGMSVVGYSSLQRLSEQIYLQFVQHFPDSGVIVVICERDIAQALGQALQRRCGLWPKVICIDQIRVEQGDYIDLGEPISGVMIPVVVKTLAFHSRMEGRTVEPDDYGTR